jgi:hypothetical protein
MSPRVRSHDLIVVSTCPAAELAAPPATVWGLVSSPEML